MSRRREALSWLTVGIVLAFVVTAALYALWPQLQPHTTLRLGDGVFSTQIADTAEKREKGLSGTSSLRDNQALLLVYDADGKWEVWMKNMNYAIDIVWLNKDKKVVHIVKNAPPESYPYEKFSPKEDARYIVELKAGIVGKKSIKIGTQAAFDERKIEGLWR